MKDRRYGMRVSSLLMALVLCISSVSIAESTPRQAVEAEIAQQIEVSDNPLINPDCTVLTDTQVISLKPDVINILILGIDDQEKDYTYRNEMAHTDAMMVLSVNLSDNNTGKTVSMLSFPREKASTKSMAPLTVETPSRWALRELTLRKS